MDRALLIDILGHFAAEPKQLDVLPGVLMDRLVWQIEQAHVTHVVHQVVEADVLVSEFLPLLTPRHSPCFYVPNRNATVSVGQLDAAFLVDAFE